MPNVLILAIIIVPLVLAACGIGQRKHYASLMLVCLVVLVIGFVIALSSGPPYHPGVEICGLAAVTFPGVLLGWIASSVRSRKGAHAAAGASLPQPSTGGMKKCPDCAEFVQADAKICRFCRHEFSSAAQRL